MLPRLFYDLESAPAPIEHLEKLMPTFAAAKNLKDEAKIAADLEEKRKSWLDDAALRATTGQIIAYTAAWNDDEPVVYHSLGESQLLAIIKDDMSRVVSESGWAYSYNGYGFDIPFICQRAVVHGLPVLRNYLTSRWKGRISPHESQIDVMREWLAGAYESKGHGLDAVAKALGLPGKTGNGKDFAKLLQTDPVEAVAYCKQDVELLRKIAKMMGL